MSGDTTEVVLGLGSNQGDSRALLQSAVDQLAAVDELELVAVSPVHLTDPVGPVADQPEFHNLVVLARTTLAPHDLLDTCQAVEQALGRVRTVVGGPRTVDVDVLDMGGRVLADDRLVLPHPRAHERAFVLVPWLEVDPGATVVGHGRVAHLLEIVGRDGVRDSDERIQLP